MILKAVQILQDIDPMDFFMMVVILDDVTKILFLINH